MSPDQLQLLDVPAVPSLTPRQQRALELVQAAGTAGIHADELGALLHEEYGRHHRDTRCQYDGANGKQILNALKKKGLVRYRRGKDFTAGSWIAVNAQLPSTTQDDGWNDLIKAGF